MTSNLNNAVTDVPAPAASHTTPTFPKPSTVKARILAALLEGRTITGLICWQEFGSSSLAHHVFTLRGTGWGIDTDMRTVRTSDGREQDVAHYSMTPDTIEAAGDAGRAFVEAVHARRRG